LICFQKRDAAMKLWCFDTLHLRAQQLPWLTEKWASATSHRFLLLDTW